MGTQFVVKRFTTIMSDSNLQPPLPAVERDPRQPADFDPISLGRMLLRGHRVAALGTLDPASGHPVTTLATYATDLDGTPVLLVSGLSHHTKNLGVDPRCSLLISRGGKGDPLAHPRLTLLATAERSADPVLRRRFLARHPKAKLYVDFPDFMFLRLTPTRIMLNGGFARAFDGDAAHLLANLPDRDTYAALEDSAVIHMNSDHGEALDLYARVLCGQDQDGWTCTGIDPHGLDLGLADRTARIAFDEPVLDAPTMRRALQALAAQARPRGQTNSS